MGLSSISQTWKRPSSGSSRETPHLHPWGLVGAVLGWRRVSTLPCPCTRADNVCDLPFLEARGCHLRRPATPQVWSSPSRPDRHRHGCRRHRFLLRLCVPFHCPFSVLLTDPSPFFPSDSLQACYRGRPCYQAARHPKAGHALARLGSARHQRQGCPVQV